MNGLDFVAPFQGVDLWCASFPGVRAMRSTSGCIIAPILGADEYNSQGIKFLILFYSCLNVTCAYTSPYIFDLITKHTVAAIAKIMHIANDTTM